MPRSLASRLIGFALSLAAGLAAPITAAAHGHAHDVAEHAEGEHSSSPGDVGAAEHSIDLRAGHAFAIEAPDAEHGGHLHPAIDAALTTKGTVLFSLVVGMRVALPLARIVVVTGPPRSDPRFELRVEAAHAPPPRLRAPPAIIA